MLLISTEHQTGNTRHAVLLAVPNPMQRLTRTNPTNLLQSLKGKKVRINWGREGNRKNLKVLITFSYNYMLHLLQIKCKESNDTLSLMLWAITERAFCAIGT